MHCIRRFERLTWAIISISLLTACTNFINAQRSSTKNTFIERVKTITQTLNSQNSDSIFNLLREEAWSLKQDSLYVDLTFQQIEKNENPVDIFQIISVLEDLMVKEYEFLKNHPKLLIFCYLNMSKYHLSRHNPLKSDLEISKYYFNRYLEVLKTIPLSDSDIQVHQNHKLNYLEKTHNDSLLFYLNTYDLPKQKKNLILTRWYRSKNDHKKELIHAKKSEHPHELLVAYRNNLQLSKVDSLLIYFFYL